MKPLLVLLALMAVLYACQTPAPEVQIVEITREVVKEVQVPVTVQITEIVEKEVEVPVTAEVTRLVEKKIVITSAPQPQPTPRPGQPTATQTPPPGLGLQIRQDVDLTQDRGGVLITIDAMTLTEIEDAQEALDTSSDYWEDVTIIGMLTITVANSTDMEISVYPDQGDIVAGSEQVEIDMWSSEDLGGDYFEGVVKEGYLTFGLKRTDINLLDSLRFVVGAPHPEDTWEPLSDEDYNFEIVITEPPQQPTTPE